MELSKSESDVKHPATPKTFWDSILASTPVILTVLATVLAIDLHLPENMLKDLAAAMLFHDVGMIFMPDGLALQSGTSHHLGKPSFCVLKLPSICRHFAIPD